MTALATTLQAFFTDRLARQRQVSPNTLAAYRDTLRLLLVFAANKKDKEPSKLDIDDLDAPLVVSTFSCPSQSAITEVSMPACSNRIAAECRKTCMVTDFCISVGQTPPAICTYLASLCSRASRLSALPERVTKRGAPGRPARSASQTRRVVTGPT